MGSPSTSSTEAPGAADLGEYGLIGDGQSAALVSSSGSIDWCCLPRFDSGALFARLLDWEGGGFCRVGPRDQSVGSLEQRYLDRTLVLETRFEGPGGMARLLDFMPLPVEDGSPALLRIVEGESGSLDFGIEVAPRFDYGEVTPWLHSEGEAHAAIGGDDGLLIRSDTALERGESCFEASVSVAAGERVRLELAFRRPEELDRLAAFGKLESVSVDESLNRTLEAWRQWSGCLDGDGVAGAVSRSALTLKALTFEQTGAIVAAPTTSLPEARDLSGARNWDYRYSWIRDAALAVRSLAELGCREDADAFRRFVERSAAGSAEELQVVFGPGGERRLEESEVASLSGFRGAAPVRVGNEASGQLQLDSFGQLVEQSWNWQRRGNRIDEEYWGFVADLVERAAQRWRDPDQGIWEWRGDPRHFVHSKALAWAAVDRGIALAEEIGKPAPEGWHSTREEIRDAIEANGYDEQRGVFVQAFGSRELDAALLRLPVAGFVKWRDERMMRTADAIREELDFDGLLLRYRADDGLPAEGAFLPCSFWLASCFARQGRAGEARAVFDRSAATAGPLGLFSEEYDPEAERMLGNYPQALTHLSHIEAALTLEEAGA